MRHLRSDYDAIQPWPVKRPHIARWSDDGEILTDVPEAEVAHVEPLIPDDEPVFLLRGQDPVAYAVVMAYASGAEAMGADPEFVAAVRGWALEMRGWAEQVQHGAPDVPDGFLRKVG